MGFSPKIKIKGVKINNHISKIVFTFAKTILNNHKIMVKNDKRTLNAWYLYDWANSTYSLTITAAIFPTYFLTVAINSQGQSQIDFLIWKSVDSSVLYAYIYSFASLIIMFLSPFLGALADYLGRKKMFMRFFCYLGATSTMLMFFADSNTLTLTLILFMISSICYSISIIFYNAYLPEIVTADRLTITSAKGYAMGYLGGLLMLSFNLTMISFPTYFGFDEKDILAHLPVQYSFWLLPNSGLIILF
ncbi:MAG: MFS transporter [Bacteroidetes bacterium]|nr:MAG: MFS transporter [Bacteroidota bacterium]